MASRITHTAKYYTLSLYHMCQVVTNVLSLPRTELKKKVVDGPEVLGVLPDLPHLAALVSSLYACDYRGYMAAMVEVNEQVRP